MSLNVSDFSSDFNPLAPELFFFLISAHPVYKMWIIQKPKKLALWNKLHFEEEKNGEYRACLKYSVPTFVEKIYKIQRLEVSGVVRLIYRSLGVKGLIQIWGGYKDF